MKTILVIEDEQALREEIAIMLKCLDFNPIAASGGREGLEMAQIYQPDLVLCDIMMPEVDGYDVLRILRQTPDTANIPFIFLTAKANRSDFRHGMNLGADDYLTKPFSPEELSAAIAARLTKQATTVQPYLDLMKQAAEQLRELAYRDPLTNLPNRILLNHECQRVLAQAHRRQQGVAVFCLSICRLKSLATTLGHMASDRLLQAVAQRLQTLTSSGDVIARIDSDEFCLVMPSEPGLVYLNDEGKPALNATFRRAIAAQAKTLLAQMAEPYSLDQQQMVRLQFNFGIALYPTDTLYTAQILDYASLALRWAQDQPDTYQFYSLELDALAAERRLLEMHLPEAIVRSQLELHYQPQVNLITGRIIGAEALLRWQHPELGLLMPNRFINIAEETGLILQIGEWVLQQTCCLLQRWQLDGVLPVCISVNLSAQQFRDRSLTANITRLLEQTGLSPDLLGLEFTETSVVADVDLAIATLKELRSLGLSIAIDDFGTGYSSLNYLRRFPINSLKIDKSFVADLNQDANSKAIVQAIIALANSLKLQVIAEGVETSEQLEFLRQHGCQTIQGYFFSPAVPADELTRLLLEDKRLQISRDTRTTPSLKLGSLSPDSP